MDFKQALSVSRCPKCDGGVGLSSLGDFYHIKCSDGCGFKTGFYCDAEDVLLRFLHSIGLLKFGDEEVQDGN